MINETITKPFFIGFKDNDNNPYYVNACSIESLFTIIKRKKKYVNSDEEETVFEYIIRLNSKKEYSVSKITFENVLKKLNLASIH